METILRIISWGAYPGATTAEYAAVAFWWLVFGWMMKQFAQDGEPGSSIIMAPFCALLAWFPTFLAWAFFDGMFS